MPDTDEVLQKQIRQVLDPARRPIGAVPGPVPARLVKCARCGRRFIFSPAKFCPRCGARHQGPGMVMASCAVCRADVPYESPDCPTCRAPGPHYPDDPHCAMVWAIVRGDVVKVAAILTTHPLQMASSAGLQAYLDLARQHERAEVADWLAADLTQREQNGGAGRNAQAVAGTEATSHSS